MEATRPEESRPKRAGSRSRQNRRGGGGNHRRVGLAQSTSQQQQHRGRLGRRRGSPLTASGSRSGSTAWQSYRPRYPTRKSRARQQAKMRAYERSPFSGITTGTIISARVSRMTNPEFTCPAATARPEPLESTLVFTGHGLFRSQFEPLVVIQTWPHHYTCLPICNFDGWSWSKWQARQGEWFSIREMHFPGVDPSTLEPLDPAKTVIAHRYDSSDLSVPFLHAPSYVKVSESLPVYKEGVIRIHGHVSLPDAMKLVRATVDLTCAGLPSAFRSMFMGE